jgi:uncharacterized phage-associated protein
MLYSANEVANTFIGLAEVEGRALTNMKLQKLVYLAHGYHLGFLGEDRPLIRDEVRAWKWGPVIVSLYERLMIYGAAPCFRARNTLGDVFPEMPKGTYERGLVQSMWEAYKDFTASKLSQMTHEKDSPWDKIWKIQPYAGIPTELIASYFRAKLEKAGVLNSDAPKPV